MFNVDDRVTINSEFIDREWTMGRNGTIVRRRARTAVHGHVYSVHLDNTSWVLDFNDEELFTEWTYPGVHMFPRLIALVRYLGDNGWDETAEALFLDVEDGVLPAVYELSDLKDFITNYAEVQ